MNFLGRTESLAPSVVASLAPDNASGQSAANFAWLNAYVIVVILLFIFTWAFSSMREGMKSPPSYLGGSQAVYTGTGVGPSLRESEAFYGAPVNIGIECGDTSAEMNYAMNVINQNNPSAKNSPFWPEYYALLSKYISLKVAANEDSTLSSWASNSFDDLKEFEAKTGFNPLQQNYFDQLPPGVQPVVISTPSIASTVTATDAVNTGDAFVTNIPGSRSRVGGFTTNIPSSRSRVGGFNVGKPLRFSTRVGGFEIGKPLRFNSSPGDPQVGASAQKLTALQISPQYLGGTDSSATQQQWATAGPVAGASQSVSTGSVYNYSSVVPEDGYQKMLY